MAELSPGVSGASSPAVAARSWFVARGRERVGPVAEDELRAMAARGEVTPTTLAWTEGMSEWAPAREAMDGLFTGLPPTMPGEAAAPPTVRSSVSLPPQGDATGGLIPYKNAPALFAYYAAVFSLLPVFPIGLIALGLGISGLKKRARHPEVKGAAHAWIGIIVGGFFGVLWLALTVLLVVAMLRA